MEVDEHILYQNDFIKMSPLRISAMTNNQV